MIVQRKPAYILMVCCLLFVNFINGLLAQNTHQSIGRDSTEINREVDSLGLSGKSIVIRDSGFTAESVRITSMVFRDDTLFRSPWGAVGRSLLVPGWGQWYNDQPLKSVVFLASDVSWIMLYKKRDVQVRRIEKKRNIIDRQLRTDPYLGQEQKRILQLRFNNLTGQLDQALNNRNIYGWLFALSHLLGMVDAFVDAHLYGFHDKMDMALLPASAGTGIALCVTFK